MIIGIAGGSGSGKSTLAKALLQHIGHDQVNHLMQDNYYRRKDPGQNLELLNYDHPDALEFELLATHLRKLKQGNAVEVPQYDFSIHNRTHKVHVVEPKPISLLEGILILSQQSIRSMLDLTVFVKASREIRYNRRAERDIYERGRSPASVLEQFNTTVSPMHNQFVEPSKAYADLIVSGEAPIEVTLKRITEALREKAQYQAMLIESPA